MKAILSLSALAALAIVFPATAPKAEIGNMGTIKSAYEGPLPPAGHASNRWKHPNGCQYTLAGRPGERVWYLIVNSSKGKNCVRYFVETPFENDVLVTRGVYAYE